MKKILLSVLLLMILIPNVVMAEENTCEQINTSDEKTIDIIITQIISNKENIDEKALSKFKFNYKILDLENNVLSETTNDDNGNITFSCFDVKSSDIGEYKLYKIIMEDNETIPFDYDPNIIYFSLRPNTTNGLFDPILAFYKDDGDDSPERYNTTYKGEVFHASEEELQGQAYAVLDKDTGVLTFFRDDENKYTNKQEIDNKTYYTDFEDSSYHNWTDYNTRPLIAKIVFKDAIKPKSIYGWFEELNELEELDISKLDTSLIESLYYFLRETHKLKKVDISTMDTTKVKDLSYAFRNSGIEYIDFNYWSFESLNYRSIPGLLNDSANLKYLNISNFNMESASAEFTNLSCLEKIVIGDDYNFYRAGFHNHATSQWYNPEKNKSYTGAEIRDIMYNGTESMAGYYIRPMCTKEASFVSSYNSSKIKNSNNESNIFENPKTGTGISIIIIFMLIISSITYIIFKRKKNYIMKCSQD